MILYKNFHEIFTIFVYINFKIVFKLTIYIYIKKNTKYTTRNIST